MGRWDWDLEQATWEVEDVSWSEHDFPMSMGRALSNDEAWTLEVCVQVRIPAFFSVCVGSCDMRKRKVVDVM
jgi:hypothetical protein